MTSIDKIFAARVIDFDIFESNGKRVGRIRDLIVIPQVRQNPPEITGIILEDNNRKRLFLRMDQIKDITNQQVIIKKFDNVKKFERRGQEKLISAEIFDQEILVVKDNSLGLIEDVAFSMFRDKYFVTDFYIRTKCYPVSFGRSRKGSTRLIPWKDIRFTAQESLQAATQFIESYSQDSPADLAAAFNDMSIKRRLEVSEELSNERLALVLAEMNEEAQTTIIEAMEIKRAARVLEAMEPDDAADLVNELPQNKANDLLEAMEPDDAAEIRRLLAYAETVAGSLMTPIPLILPPEATVAEALAHIQQEDISPANASTVFICRPPLETPTGKYLGSVHFQCLLRTPPGEPVGSILDKATIPVTDYTPIPQVVRQLATYDLVSLPVINSKGNLVGAITVDDVLDHLLPEDWRDSDDEENDSMIVGGLK